MKNNFKSFLITLFLFTNVLVAQGYEIGDLAEDFRLKNVDGNYVSLKDMKEAKGYLVIFTCNTCPYSVAYENRIIDLDKKFKPLGVPVVAINPNNPVVKPGDSFLSMQQRAKEKGFEFPYLLDEGQMIYPKYGATRTPHVFLLENTDEGYRVRYIGAIDDNYQDETKVEDAYVEDAVNAMLAGKDIKVQTTRAIGCSIKA